MKRHIFVYTFILLAVVSIAYAELPRQEKPYVNDFANMLDDTQEDTLVSLFRTVELTSTAQVFLVTVETTEPYTPSEYRTKLFEAWGVGKKDVDNGLLIVYAKKEKRIEVEVGYGLEGLLPDSKVGRILDEKYVLLRDQGNVSQGIFLASQEFGRIVNDASADVKSGATAAPPQSSALKTIFIVVFIIIFIVIAILSRTMGGGVGGFRPRSRSTLGGFRTNTSMGGGFGGGGRSGGGGAGR